MRNTRRAYLAATAGALTLGTAGCLGGGSSRSGNDAVAAIGCGVPERDTVSLLPTPTIESEDMSVIVNVWEDFACPHYTTFVVDVAPQFRSEYVSEGIVRYRHHDFPIPMDEWWSWKGASAARAAQDETDDETLFDLAHTLYENQSEFGGDDAEGSLSALQSLAADADLDDCSAAATVSYEHYRPLVEAKRTEAVNERGLQGTPTVLIDGEQVAPRWSDLQRTVENARQSDASRVVRRPHHLSRGIRT